MHKVKHMDFSDFTSANHFSCSIKKRGLKRAFTSIIGSFMFRHNEARKGNLAHLQPTVCKKTVFIVPFQMKGYTLVYTKSKDEKRLKTRNLSGTQSPCKAIMQRWYIKLARYACLESMRFGHAIGRDKNALERGSKVRRGPSAECALC